MKVIILFALIFLSNAYCAEYFTDLSLTGPFIVGGQNQKQDDLQSNNVPQESRLEGGMITNERWTFGFGFSYLRNEYVIDSSNNTIANRNFSSRSKLLYLRGGKVLMLAKNFIFEILARLGKGNFLFSENGEFKKKKVSSYLVSTEIRLNYEVLKNLYLSFGTGLRQSLVNDFEYRGSKFGRSDFDPSIYHSIGIGLKF